MELSPLSLLISSVVGDVNIADGIECIFCAIRLSVTKERHQCN